MWTDLLTAFALYMIIEGMLPFASPHLGNGRQFAAHNGLGRDDHGFDFVFRRALTGV